MWRIARPIGHHARRRVAGWRLAVAAGGRCGAECGAARRRPQRVADRLPRAAGVDGDAGVVVAVSRTRRGAHRRRGQLHGSAGVVPVARPRVPRRYSPPDARPAAGRAGRRRAAPSHDPRARVLRDRLERRRRAACRRQSLQSAGRTLRAVRAGRRPGRYYLRRPSGAGQGRRRDRLRAHGHHRRRAWRRGDHGRRGHDRRHDPRPAGDGRAAEWAAPGGVAGRTGRDSHGRAADGRAGCAAIDGVDGWTEVRPSWRDIRRAQLQLGRYRPERQKTTRCETHNWPSCAA